MQSMQLAVAPAAPACRARVLPGSRQRAAAATTRTSAARSTNSAHHCEASTSGCGAQLAVASKHGRRNVACKASTRPAVFLFGFGGGGYVEEEEEYDDETYTVLKLQVGVFGDVAKWQRDLARLSTLYDTDEEGGLHAIFLDTLQQLQRNTEYTGYCTSGGRIYDDLASAESKFNEVSFDERGKFKEETLINVDGRTATKASSSRISADVKDLDQWLCITLLLAVERELKLPKVNTVWELKQAIKLLAGITVDELVAFELLWTPQDNGDSYSKDELLADYPTMVTLT